MINENILGPKIKEIRKLKRMTQKELSQLTKFKQNTISQHENGKRNLDENDIYIYSKALGVSVEELFGDFFGESSDFVKETQNINIAISEIETIYNKLEKTRQTKVLNFAKNELEEQNKTQEDEVYYNYVPFYGYASAGTGQPIYDTPVDTIKIKGYVPMHDLALLTSGDSMEPLYKNGDVIFINKTPEVQNGQIGVFILDGECFVKKLRIDDDGTVRLVSLNKKYKDIIINEHSNFTVVGKVVM